MRPRAPRLLLLALLTGCADPAPDSGDRPGQAPPSDGEGAGGEGAVGVAVDDAGVVGLAAWGRAPRRAATDSTDALLAAELARDAGAAAIEAALASEVVAVRERAVLTLARIGGVAARRKLLAMVGDGRVEMTSSMLAAIGLLSRPDDEDSLASPSAVQWTELEDALWTRYAITRRAEDAAALLLAIARSGGGPSVARLAVDLSELPGGDAADELRYERGMEALAVLCGRGHPLDASALDVVARGLAADTVRPRRAAAYALGRCAGPSAEQLAGEERGALVEMLGVAVASKDDGEARLAWRALESLGEMPAGVPDDVLGRSPREWRIEVAAVRALAASADGRAELAARLGRLLPKDLAGPRWHVLHAALSSLRPAVDGKPTLLDALVPLRDRVRKERQAEADVRRKKALVLADCELAVLFGIRSGDLEPLRACATSVDGLPNDLGQTLAVEALLAAGASIERSVKVDALLAAAEDARPRVAEAGLTALAELDDPRVGPLLRRVMSGSDVGRTSAAAGAIAARAVDASKRDPEAVPVLTEAVARLSNDTAVEARVATIEALGKLARSAPTPGTKGGEATPLPDAPWLESAILPLASDPNRAVRDAARRALAGHLGLVARFDAAVPPSFPNGFAPSVGAALKRDSAPKGLTVRTSAGTIEIAFAGVAAPIAQANLAALAEAKSFDGLTFHRVVPGFVVQGGDPRGDGYGGPGHVMPCEWSNLRYERGTVGIALAGKDTGGSQFFITHGAPHHLDARYTVIGHVTKGMDAVDQLLRYDEIESVAVR